MDANSYNTWWKDSERAHNQWAKAAKIALDFVLPNRQWDREDINKLDSEAKPHLTINKIFPVVYFLSGYQRQNKFDIIVEPKKGGADTEAKILSECIKGMVDNDDGQYEISEWFLQGIIKGCGWIGGYVDYADDPINGDLHLESLNPFTVFPDPNSSKYGNTDAAYIFKRVWKSVDEIRSLFPGKVDDINASEITSPDDIIGGSGEEYRDEAPQLINKHRQKVRLKECWYLKDKNAYFVIDPQNGQVQEIPGTEAEVKNILTIRPELQITQRNKKVLCLATIMGETILQDIENPIGRVNRLPFIPFYAYKIDDNVFGAVDQLLDVQREVNKRRSQALHIVNTMTNNLWMLPESAGLSEDEFAKKVSRVGGVVKYGGNSVPLNVGPTGAQGAQLATYSAEGAEQDIKEISGVNADLMGYGQGRAEPGIVLQLRQSQGAVVIEPIFDNFKYSNRLLGSLLIDFIQKSGLYSQDEIVKITDADGQEVGHTVNEILSDMTIKKFKVTVSSQKASPTLRAIDFAKLMELVKLGLPIPPEVLIEASDLPMKSQILQGLNEAKMAAQSPAGGPAASLPGGGIGG